MSNYAERYYPLTDADANTESYCNNPDPIARLSALTEYEKDQLRELGYDESDIEYMTVEDIN